MEVGDWLRRASENRHDTAMRLSDRPPIPDAPSQAVQMQSLTPWIGPFRLDSTPPRFPGSAGALASKWLKSTRCLRSSDGLFGVQSGPAAHRALRLLESVTDISTGIVLGTRPTQRVVLEGEAGVEVDVIELVVSTLAVVLIVPTGSFDLIVVNFG